MILVVRSGPDGHEAPMHYLIAAVIGLVGGVTSGLFGVGGGVVMVPAMFYLLKLDLKTAIGTSLVVIIPTANMTQTLICPTVLRASPPFAALPVMMWDDYAAATGMMATS